MKWSGKLIRISESDKIVFYNASVCPFAQRAAIALREVEADFEEVAVYLQNKPDWYKDVNPELKVPALKTEDTNIAEFLVIIEYLADSYPEKKLLPESALQRAQIRFAIEYFGSKINGEWFKLINNHKSDEVREDYDKNINTAFNRFDELLRQQSTSGPYFSGEKYSLADIAIAPFYARIKATNQFVLENYQSEAVKNSPRLAEFLNGIISRPSFQESYLGDEMFIEMMKKRMNA
ncbi:glutathione S-transferase [Backusella circina FSU 941]|nr:glutathione S-transferase [Backusella circina FSU 941]